MSSAVRGQRSRVVTIATAFFGLVLVAAVIGGVHLVNRRGGRATAASQEHAVTLAISLQDGSTLRSIRYLVKSSAGVPIAQGNWEVTNPKGPLSVDISVPPGRGNVISFAGESDVGGEKSSWFLGSRTFDVVEGQPTRVDFGTVWAGVPGGAAAAPTAATDTTSTTLPSASAGGPTADCQTCELSAEKGKCDREFLTAQLQDDKPTWGCGTLMTPREQATCVALLRCLNQVECADGENPFKGCYCGSASLAQCLVGEGVAGPCVPQYEAAATAAGGPPAGSSTAQFARFLSEAGTNPRTPVGLADNIKECAIQAHCASCDSL